MNSSFAQLAKHPEYYNLSSPLDSETLNVIGIYLSLVFILSSTFNTMLIWIFMRHKELRSLFNFYILAISVINLMGTSVLPLIIHSSLSHRWTSFRLGCVLSGFISYFSASTNVYLMTLISIERFYLIRGTFKVNKKLIIKSVIICCLIGLFWSSMPLVGWSYYTYEKGYVGCCVEYKERTLNVISYNICMFIFVFIIPFSIIVITNLKSVLSIKSMRNTSLIIIDFRARARNFCSIQKKMTFILFVYIAGFVITWSPYAFVSLYSAFLNSDHITPLLSTMPAIFAKTSMALSTLFYTFTHRQLKSKFKLTKTRFKIKYNGKNIIIDS